MERFKAISLVSLVIIFLANDHICAQNNHVFLSETDYFVLSSNSESITIEIYRDSVLNLLYENSTTIHLQDEEKKTVVAGKMGYFDAAYPKGCNYYYHLEDRDDCNNIIILRWIPPRNRRMFPTLENPYSFQTLNSLELWKLELLTGQPLQPDIFVKPTP